MHTWPALVIAPQGRVCSCEPSTTMSSRRADVHFSHAFTAASRHAKHGVHTCVWVWHATLAHTRSLPPHVLTLIENVFACTDKWHEFLGHITDQISEATLGLGQYIISYHAILTDVVCRTHASLQCVVCLAHCHTHM